MSFTSDARGLRGDTLIMPETHIVMSFLIFRLALSLSLCLTLLLVLCLSSLMDLIIARMILVHERTTLSLDVLITAHVLIVVIVSRVGLFFLLEGPRFPRRGSYLTQPSGEVQRTVKASSDRMVKCWISKIYLTNPSTESSTFSRPV
jgi:hypothetical protein